MSIRKKVGCVFLGFLAVSSASAEPNKALLQELRQLKVELFEQYQGIEERLARLEALISPEYSVKVIPQTDSASVPTAAVEPVISRWQQPSAWNSIQPGMSRAEVEAILGQPSSERSNIINYITLTYEGRSAVGDKEIGGSVTLTDNDRVEYRGIQRPSW